MPSVWVRISTYKIGGGGHISIQSVTINKTKTCTYRVGSIEDKQHGGPGGGKAARED